MRRYETLCRERGGRGGGARGLVRAGAAQRGRRGAASAAAADSNMRELLWGEAVVMMGGQSLLHAGTAGESAANEGGAEAATADGALGEEALYLLSR